MNTKPLVILNSTLSLSKVMSIRVQARRSYKMPAIALIVLIRKSVEYKTKIHTITCLSLRIISLTTL